MIIDEKTYNEMINKFQKLTCSAIAFDTKKKEMIDAIDDLKQFLNQIESDLKYDKNGMFK